MTASRPPLFQRVAIIGLGLIGGSLAAAIREQGLARTVVAGSPSAPSSPTAAASKAR